MLCLLILCCSKNPHVYKDMYTSILSLQYSVLQAVDDSLKSVNLFHGGVGDKQVGKYCGGMKRRLSVAISLIGDPKVPPSLLFMFFTAEYTLACATDSLIPLGGFHG